MAGNHTPGLIRDNPCKSVARFRVNVERPAGIEACGPPGGLFGIDQEVVTLTWPLRQLRLRCKTFALPALLTDLRQAEAILKSPVVCGL